MVSGTAYMQFPVICAQIFLVISYMSQLVHVNNQQLNTSLMLKCTFQDEKEGTANWKRLGRDNFWVTIWIFYIFLFAFSTSVVKIFRYLFSVYHFLINIRQLLNNVRDIYEIMKLSNKQLDVILY